MKAYIFMMILVAILVILAGIYLYHYIKRILINFGVKKKWVIRGVAGGLTVITVLRGVNMFSIGATMMLFIIVSCAITDILNILMKKYIKKEMGNYIWNKLYCGGLLAIVFIIGITVYAYLNMITIEQKNYTMTTTKDLGADQLRIVQISDLHLGTTMNTDKLQKILEDIEQLKPDLLVLTGDIFDESTKKEEMEKAAELFGKVDTTDGVYYVLGNHDSNLYVKKKQYTQSSMIETLTESKITVLEDQSMLINNQFYLIGRKDASLEATGSKRKTPEELTKGLDKSKYIIMLDHQPIELEEAAKAGVDLELSGHTHGGQVWPTGQLSTLFGSNELNYGKKTIGSYTEIVSSGIAGWGYPLRTGGQSEYVVIDIK